MSTAGVEPGLTSCDSWAALAPFRVWISDISLPSCASIPSHVPLCLFLAALACRTCSAFPWSMYLTWKCTHPGTMPRVSLLSASRVSHARAAAGCCYLFPDSPHQLAHGSHGCSIFALMWGRVGRDVCSEGPSLAGRDSSAVHLAATDQLWGISILRNTERAYFCPLSPDSGALSPTSSGRLVFLFTCQCHCCVSSLSGLMLTSATYANLLAANGPRSLISQPTTVRANTHTHTSPPLQ